MPKPSFTALSLTFLLMASATPALATSKKPPAAKPAPSHVNLETYAALEEDDEVSAITPHAMTVSPRKQPASDLAPAKVLVANPPSEKFEVVPAERREEVMKRLQLCQTLILESGRAYDYRSMKTKDLEKELASLKSAPTDHRQTSAVAASASSEN